MKALILNSGLGSRMGVITSEHPKCMTEISYKSCIYHQKYSKLPRFSVWILKAAFALKEVLIRFS